MASHRRTAAAGVAVILASVSLYPIFSGVLWFWAGCASVIVVALAGTATRLRRLPVLAEVTHHAYRVLVLEGGLDRNLTIDRDGAAHVIKLREKYGKQQGTLGRPDHYIDDSFRRSALTDR